MVRCVEELTKYPYFIDAGKTAYVACIFLRSHCPLLQARSTIAPMKTSLQFHVSELMAAVIGARLFWFYEANQTSPYIKTSHF
ncbi:hypothetical protein NPIL_339891 [Nephila pilipes]|uniref:Uncharacterized protein n=1 Tax=Nephila pilipes TaxID=299642 RepID=A0A8X6N0C8_NEPPI|nr:hypothetical protein NPIL_339891 [Nephila pilipes]